MKNRLYKVLGVVLPIMMVLALAVMLLLANTQTAEAALGTLRFEAVPVPKIGSAGDYFIAPETDCGPFTIDTSGSVFYAAANITDAANINTLLKSNSGGTSWQIQSAFRTTATANSDNTAVVAIGASPEYITDTTMFVATTKYVYQTVDGGATFTAMTRPSGWAGTETISDMDITLDEGGRLSIIIGSEDSAGAGDVYVYCPATTGMSWKAQAIARDVLAVAFSPNFASDESIMAVTANATGAEMRVSFGSTKDGGGWGDSIGDAQFLDGTSAITNANRARIAFPDDYDVDSLTSNIAFVGLGTAGTIGSSTEFGDAFKVILETGSSSTAIDLNVRGIVSLQLTYTNIWSIDVSGDAEAANIIVGLRDWSTATTPDYWLAYYSTDSGENWYSARTKSPTGGTMAWTTAGLLESGTAAQANVLMADDFATSGVAYVVTKGAETSALSRTADGGKSWNQISLIDYADTTNYYTVKEMDVLSTEEWYIRLEYSANKYSSLWLTTSGGSRYERVYSYANPTFPLNYDGLYIKGDVYFLKNSTLGKFWRSEDKGATFPRIITAKAALTGSSIVNGTTIYTLHDGGEMYYTENLGRPWVKPEESIMTGKLKGISRKGNIHLVKDDSGRIYVSTDASKTYTKTLGANDLSYGSTTFDPDFAENKYIYKNVSGSVGGGIWRIKFNEEAPDSTEWQQIDNITDAASAARVKPSRMNISNGIMYIFDGAAANVTPTPDYAGGIWRCTNPSADIDGIYPPRFARYTNGLANDDVLSYKSSKSTDAGRVYYVTNSILAGTANYYNQLLTFNDTLNKPVTLVAPDNGATGVGVRLETIDLTMEVLAGWASMPSALTYEYQLALDEEFLSPIAAESASGQEGQQARFDNLSLGWTYYWRVRVDSPLWSPWSEARSFTVDTIEPEVPVVVFGIISPERGATDVSIQPTFVWAEYEGAVSYELVVAEDPTFAIIDWSRTSENPFYKAEEVLAYSTTYAWKVRAAPDGPWAAGVFTTEAAPVEPVEPIVIEPTPPPEVKIIEVPAAAPIPAYLLWTIIGVGAVLFIALIVLIVRTRRVT